MIKVVNISDEFDDIIEKIKKYFNLDSNIFDVDFLFLPESERKLDLKPGDKKIKGFKVSYHFETGMEKPEIRIEGNLDEKKIQEYLKGIDMSQRPNLTGFLNSNNIEEIDASSLSLEASDLTDDLSVIEPQTEINDYNNYIEIVLEIPGMSEEDVSIDFNEDGNNLIFKAENNLRSYVKYVYLPFTVSTNVYDMEVKNGLAIILIKKSDEKLLLK